MKKITILSVLHHWFIWKNCFSLVSSQANKHLKGNKCSTNEIFSLTNCLGVVPEKYVLFDPPLVTMSYLLIQNWKNQKLVRLSGLNLTLKRLGTLNIIIYFSVKQISLGRSAIMFSILTWKAQGADK